uniref:MARVEL domain-containing protein n=1 Tax=Rhinolophus ferrumequinum TaxID=59479 RepID=A0A671ESA3_RHIFE
NQQLFGKKESWSSPSLCQNQYVVTLPGLLMEALACFVISKTHESYIAIAVLETCIVLFFILIYMLTIHRLMTCIHWPLLDLINSFITAVSLFIVAAFTMQEKEQKRLLYVGGALCFAAAIVCLVDATIVTKTMRNKVKRVLGIESETRSSPSRVEPTPKPAPAGPTPTPAP